MDTVIYMGPGTAGANDLRAFLEAKDLQVLTPPTADQAISLAREYEPVMAILDLARDTRERLSLCATLKRETRTPFITVMLIAPPSGVERADLEPLLAQSGYDAVATRPIEPDELYERVQNLINLAHGVRLSGVSPQSASFHLGGLGHLIGRSPAMTRVFKLLSAAAPTDCAVLILGETGTGKELAAKTLHELSKRRDKPYVAVNLAAFNENMVESELFGHEAGAFTGAVKRRIGCLERADGGSLYLDEVDSVPVALQIKLLRALQERRFERVGGEKTIPLDFRLVASATGMAHLRTAIENNGFRRDFFYRLQGVIVPLPPLRERLEDIPLLVGHFLERLAVKYGRRLRLGPNALEVLMRHSWPGNVRELERAVESAVVLSEGNTIESIPVLDEMGEGDWQGGSRAAAAPSEAAMRKPAGPVYSSDAITAAHRPGRPAFSAETNYEAFAKHQRDQEAAYFRELLARCKGDRREAVRQSGLSRATFYRRLRILGLIPGQETVET